jgi:glutamate-1-semialdehyde 2,1-aminomutase
MQLKRLYLSTAHTREILDESLGVIEDVLKTLV